MSKHIIHFIALGIIALMLWYSIGLHDVADRRDMTLNEWPVWQDDYEAVNGSDILTTYISDAAKEMGF